MSSPNWIMDKAKFWHKLPAPCRPWPSEVAWFEKYVLEKRSEGKKDVLVLGSTVEFRSMLHKNKMNVHVVDFSKDFYNILTKTQFGRLKYRGKEVVYEENWLTMNLGKKFDLMMGDWVPGVLHTKDYGAFYNKIIAHLKDDGLFIGRECVRPNNEKINLNSVLNKHLKAYAGRYNLFESSSQYFYGYHMTNEDMIIIKDSLDAIKAVKDKKILADKGYKQLLGIFTIEKNPWSVKLKNEFEADANKYLKILAEHHVPEPSSDWYPVYVMGKK